METCMGHGRDRISVVCGDESVLERNVRSAKIKWCLFILEWEAYHHHQAMIAQMPTNIREELSQFNVESNTVVYAVCPNCHFTYAPQFVLGDGTPKYPSHCMHQPTLESDMCGQPLLRYSQSGLHKPQPIKPFIYYSFHDYLAMFLSCKDLKGLMDKACDDLHSTSSEPLLEFTLDIWDTEFLRNFEGPENDGLFVARRKEGRYLFTFNYNTFNIEGMEIHGTTTSCSLLSMVCHNIPLDICNKPKNMYVTGIIPSPHLPKETQLNQYLQPLFHNFTTVNNSATNLPPGLSNKEAKQVSTIHQLLKSAYTDKEDDDSQWSQLQKQLMNKNILALKFVCNDLNLFPGHCLHSTKLFKKDWVSKHMCWVSLIPALWHVIPY